MMVGKFAFCALIVVILQAIQVESFYEEKEQEKHTTAKLNITVCNSARKNCNKGYQETGVYGKHSLLEDASGWIFRLEEGNQNGCEELRVEVNIKPWIALIQRGTCSFDKKIENAFRHNASAVIIYGKDDNKLFEMRHPGTDYGVAISIQKNIGENLVSELSNKTVFVEILVGQSHRKWQVNPTSVLFVSVSFIVLMVISLAWLVFYYVQRFRYVHARDKTEKRLSSAAKKAIAKLPTRNIGKKDEEEEVDSCPVCLDGYKAGDTVRVLPCQHEYHKLCIDPWLVEHRTCPMCKLNILKELGLPTATGTPASQTTSRNIEVATIEPQDYEDHVSAADNPVLFLGDVEPGSLQSSRRPSCGGESSGSSDSSVRVLHVSADINWERDEQTSSTSNLVEPGTVRS